MKTSFIVSIFFAICAVQPAIASEDSPASRPLEYRFDAAASRIMFHPVARSHEDEANQRRERHAEPALGMLGTAQPAETAARFGSAGSVRLNVHGGFGADVKTMDNRLALLGVGWSFFIFDNLSLELELNGMHFNQVGRDAIGGNVNLLFRWHFLARETWSMYADAGAGALFTNRKVPAHGSKFNFTPQAGFGFSFDIGNDLRLMTGVRWHHVSNASIYRSNPGRDHVMGYVGVSMPF